ncbi:MAG: hypothetical protein IT430_03860, partial [Phycisphaerales bacterium]|nr:hypothetical protein [Phycisphaerales bacterium]
MATSALKRILLGKYPCITTSDTPPHGRCTLSPAKRQAIREYAEGIAVLAMIAIVALLLLAVGGCAAPKHAAEAYHKATIVTHDLILPDLVVYVQADDGIDELERAARLKAITRQETLDDLNTPSPEYCAATIANHATLLPQARQYFEADPELTGGALRLRTLVIEEQQRLDAQWQLDFGAPTPTPNSTPTGVNRDGQINAEPGNHERAAMVERDDRRVRQGSEDAAGRRGQAHGRTGRHRDGLLAQRPIDDGQGRRARQTGGQPGDHDGDRAQPGARG